MKNFCIFCDSELHLSFDEKSMQRFSCINFSQNPSEMHTFSVIFSNNKLTYYFIEGTIDINNHNPQEYIEFSGDLNHNYNSRYWGTNLFINEKIIFKSELFLDLNDLSKNEIKKTINKLILLKNFQ